MFRAYHADCRSDLKLHQNQCGNCCYPILAGLVIRPRTTVDRRNSHSTFQRRVSCPHSRSSKLCSPVESDRRSPCHAQRSGFRSPPRQAWNASVNPFPPHLYFSSSPDTGLVSQPCSDLFSEQGWIWIGPLLPLHPCEDPQIFDDFFTNRYDPYNWPVPTETSTLLRQPSNYCNIASLIWTVLIAGLGDDNACCKLVTLNGQCLLPTDWSVLPSVIPTLFFATEEGRPLHRSS